MSAIKNAGRKTYRKVLLLITTIFLIALIAKGLIWLAIFLLSLFTITFTLVRCLKKVRFNILTGTLLLLSSLFFSLLTGACIKLFMLDIYRIPSNSMEDTLLPDDIILVNKLSYGPTLPQNPFEVSWLNLFFYFSSTAKSRMNDKWWPYYRLDGYSAVKRSDILIYRLYKDYFVAKRCIGLPGDEITLKDGAVLVNQHVYIEPGTVRNNYRIQVNDQKKFYRQLMSLNKELQVSFDTVPNSFTGNFSAKMMIAISQFSTVRKVELIREPFREGKNLFVDLNILQWTLDDLGPLTVPKRGMKILLTPQTYALYHKVIEEREGTPLTENNGIIRLNGTPVSAYVFKQDYFFVLGDNRKFSDDSRIVGFIPESEIIGKVECVLYSTFEHTFRWGRLLHSSNIQ